MKLKVIVHPAFLLLGLILVFTGGGALFLAYTATLLLHESAHGLAARRLGYALDTVCLMPYGAKISGDTGVMRPQDEVLIALAGPLVNVAAVVACTSLWWVFPATYAYTADFVTANFFTALFNLIPVFPLDGGRILLAALSGKIKAARAIRIVRIAGVILSAVFCALFAGSLFFGVNFTLITIAVFFFLSAALFKSGDGYMRIFGRSFRKSLLKNGLKVTELMFPEGIAPVRVMSAFKPDRYFRVTFTDENLTPLFTLTETEIEDLCEQDMYKPVMRP